jgi:molybdate/tungstate transport system substrate-binding protein
MTKKIFILASYLIHLQLSSQVNPSGLSGNLIIFHAGSLSAPMHEISVRFMELHPDVKILAESAGSVASIRKVTDLQRDCDIIASSDYSIIDQMLIPGYASWNIAFAGNEMAIVYHEHSRFSEKIQPGNWTEILLSPEVITGRSDPNSDPCGYRTVMMIKLSEMHYNKPRLARQLLTKDVSFMRPKEVDLLALLESGSVDYIFLYKSVAIQHGLKFLRLPNEINLSDPRFTGLYKTVSVEINGSAPGEKIILYGEPMIYGITILDKAPNKPAAVEFLRYLLSADLGMKLMEEMGQPSVIPLQNPNYNLIPEPLKNFCSPQTKTDQ